MNEDIRQQVILALGVEGQENADLILQAIYKVKEEQEKLVASLGQQGVETQKVVAEITKLAGVLGSLSTIYNGLTGATQYLKDAEAAEAQAAREAAAAEKLLAEQLKNDSTNARKVAAQAAKDEAQILRTEMAEAAREAAAAEKLLAEQLRNESVNARKVAAQAARDEADVIKNQLIVAEMQNAATNQMLAESEKALAAATRGDGVAAKKQSAQASKEAADLNKLLEESTVALARADSKLSDTRDKGRGSADASTQTMLHWTRTVYFASQAVDDLQYGFRSIVNNLPLIGMSVSQALGGTSVVGMQVGAAVGIASVAINQLIPVVQHFVDQRPALQAFGRTFVETLNPFHVDQMKTSLESLNERIKELQGKKVRLAVEDFELDVSIRKAKELQKALEAAEEARTGRSKAERESGRAVEEILAEAPGGEPALFGRLAGQMAAKDFAQHPEMRAIEAEEQKARNRVEWAKRQGTYDDVVEERFQQRMEALAEDRRKLRETVAKGAEATMGDVFRRAKLGDVGAQQQLIGLTGGIGPAAGIGGPVGMPSLAAQIAGVSPAETRARLEHEEEIPALKEQADEHKRIIKENKELMQQGAENIREGAEEKAREQKKVDDEAARIAHGAQQKAVTDDEKAAAARQREVERQARGLEGGKGGLAEQLSPAILARMARGQDVETIIAGLAPQVAGRVGRIPTVPAGMAPDISRQIVQDVLAKQGAPMAGEMAFAPNAQLAAMGLQAQGAARAMEGAQRQGLRAQRVGQAAMQQAEAAALANETGMAPQVALNVVQATHKLMAQGFSQQRALAMAWQQQAHHLQQLQQQVNQFENQMMQMQTRQQPQRGHHWPGFFGGF